MPIERLPELPGKFAASVKVGPKGQIVIPKGARDLFGINPGDTVLIEGDQLVVLLDAPESDYLDRIEGFRNPRAFLGRLRAIVTGGEADGAQN